MNQCYAYTRVSTVRQGEKGVSLQEQKAAIERYAARHEIEIVEWFEEKVSAAKKGRPVFTKMLRSLKKGRAQGVVIHKIDRGARNLRDWAALGELIDQDVAVHFVNESIDLSSRGGRLSADIQAVVAADYIRNLREETRKGFYGRLRQGIYPLAAPLGYTDCGGGKVKTIDSVRAPLVRKAFELYASGEYSLESLSGELFRRGLRNRAGKRVAKNALSLLLNNPFYIGLIHIKTTGETFQGRHEPLITKDLFDRVRAALRGKTQKQVQAHDFLFRGLFRCGLCGRSLIGERQKGHVYYRCQVRDCPTTGFREERIEGAVRAALAQIELTPEEREGTLASLEALVAEHDDLGQTAEEACRYRLEKIADRMARLTDAFVDGDLEKDLFQERKRLLLEERTDVEDQLRQDGGNPLSRRQRISDSLELATTALLSYESGATTHKRRMLETVFSNREGSPGDVLVEPDEPFSIIRDWRTVSACCPRRYRSRTCDELATRLWRWISVGCSRSVSPRDRERRWPEPRSRAISSE